MTLHGHPLARDLESWWLTHGGQSEDPAWEAFLNDYADLLTSKIAEQKLAHDNKGRFGMSKAGGCTRAAVLKLMGADSAPLSGSTRVTFWLGHAVEILGLASLRALGVPVAPLGVDGKQWETRIDPYMLSATDGLVAPHEGLSDEPMTLTVKSGGYKGSSYTKGGWKRFGFAQYPFDGVRGTNPGYWAQAQAEMYGTGRKKALFLLVAKDIIKKMEDDPYLGPKGNGSLSFYCEVIERDDAWIEEWLLPVWASAWVSYQQGEIPTGYVLGKSGKWVHVTPSDPDGNKKRTELYNVCDYCDFRSACESVTVSQALEASIKEKEITNG